MATKQQQQRRPSQNETQQNQGTSTALIVPKANEIIQKLNGFDDVFRKLIPHGSRLSSERLLAQVHHALLDPGDKGEKLRQCHVGSIVNAVGLAADLALEINTPLGHGALIPFGRVCTFQPMWRGLVTLALRGARTHSVQSHVVMRRDTFEYRYGTSPMLEHVPNGDEVVTDVVKDDWVYTYAIVRYRDGGEPEFLVMSRPQVEMIRDKSSQAWKQKRADSPWFTYPEEMIRKTPVKRLLKSLDLSEQLSRAIGLDDLAISGTAQDKIVDAVGWREIDPEQDEEGTQGDQTQPEQQQQQQQHTNGHAPSDKLVGPFSAEDFSDKDYNALLDMWKEAGRGNRAQFDAFLGKWKEDRQTLREYLQDQVANR